MKRLLVVLVIFISIFICSQNLFASPIYNPDTGHWYEKVFANGDWYQAESNAVALGGHLVTISNAAENDWVLQNFNILPDSISYWIGLTQAPIDPQHVGPWGWVSGEPITYTNWHLGEPNDSYRIEHWAHIYMYASPPNIPGFYGNWNDRNTPNIYEMYGIAEYSGHAPVPEPSSLLLMGFGGIVTAFIKRRRTA